MSTTDAKAEATNLLIQRKTELQDQIQPMEDSIRDAKREIAEITAALDALEGHTPTTRRTTTPAISQAKGTRKKPEERWEEIRAALAASDRPLGIKDLSDQIKVTEITVRNILDQFSSEWTIPEKEGRKNLYALKK